MQHLSPSLRGPDDHRSSHHFRSQPSHSQRGSGDHPAGPEQLAEPVLEPLTGEDTLPSSFHVESVYSHALMGDDTISTWAPGSQQDTARSRRPEPASNQTNAPSSQASDKLPTAAPHHGLSRAAQIQDAAPRPSVSYMRPSTTPVARDPGHPWPNQPAHSVPQPHVPTADGKSSSSASLASASSHFQLAAKNGSKQRPAGAQHTAGSSHSYELPASSWAKHEPHSALQSSMSGAPPLSAVRNCYCHTCPHTPTHLSLSLAVHSLCSYLMLGMHIH